MQVFPDPNPYHLSRFSRHALPFPRRHVPESRGMEGKIEESRLPRSRFDRAGRCHSPTGPRPGARTLLAITIRHQLSLHLGHLIRGAWLRGGSCGRRAHCCQARDLLPTSSSVYDLQLPDLRLVALPTVPSTSVLGSRRVYHRIRHGAQASTCNNGRRVVVRACWSGSSNSSLISLLIPNLQFC